LLSRLRGVVRIPYRRIELLGLRLRLPSQLLLKQRQKMLVVLKGKTAFAARGVSLH
jgi:hypothetical protein